MVVGSTNVLSRVRDRVGGGQGTLAQRYSRPSALATACNFSLVPDASSSSRATLSPLPGKQLRPLHASGSAPERVLASTDGDLIRIGLRPPYELQVDYNLQSIGEKLHDHPSWTAFLLAFDVEKLRQLGHGQSLDELCACTRRLTWVVRSCRCSEFVPLEVRSGSSTAKVTLTPAAGSRHSCMAIVRVVVCLKEGESDTSERGVTNNWICWGEPLVVRTLPPLDKASEELQLSATENLIAQLSENLRSANSEREDLESRMEAAMTKCNEENAAALRAEAALTSIRAGHDPEAVMQQEALQSEFRSSENEQDVLRRGLFAALELAGERGRTEASLKRELDTTEKIHCDLRTEYECLQDTMENFESGARYVAEQEIMSLQVERDATSELLAAASSSYSQEAKDLQHAKKKMKMAETEHAAAMQDLRESVDKLRESERLERSTKFSLDAAEAANNSLQVELLVARKDAALEAATEADLEKRLQASETFGAELKRQLQIANEEHLAAVQLHKQVGIDPPRSSQTWKETSDCSTSASSPNPRRPESSPSTTLLGGSNSEIFASPARTEGERSDSIDLRSGLLSAALSEVEDVRSELAQSMLRIAQLERSEDALGDKLVAASAEQFVLNIDLQPVDDMEEEQNELRRKLAALGEEHARLSQAFRTPAKLLWLVEAAIVSFTLDKFDYHAFIADEVLFNDFRSKVKEVIAKEAGEPVKPHYVELETYEGSLKVIAKVETPSGQELSAQMALFTSTALETRLVESVKSIPGIFKYWNSPPALTNFGVEVPWSEHVKSRLSVTTAKHLDMQSELNCSVQLCDSLVTKWLLHSSMSKLQAQAQEQKLQSLELEQDALRGEFKDAALRSIVETVTTRLEMDAALDIARTETEMQQKLEENLESLHRCHEESLRALSIAERRSKEVGEESDKAGIAKAEGAWLAAIGDACSEQDALRRCLTSTLDSQGELKSELDIEFSQRQVFESECSELRMHLQHELEEHATLQSKMGSDTSGFGMEEKQEAADVEARIASCLEAALKFDELAAAESSKEANVEDAAKAIKGEHGAGESTLKLSDVSGLSAGMSLTVSGAGKTETKTIVSVNPDSSVTLDSPLQHTYPDSAPVEAIPQGTSDLAQRLARSLDAALKSGWLAAVVSSKEMALRIALEKSHAEKEAELRNAKDIRERLEKSHAEMDAALEREKSGRRLCESASNKSTRWYTERTEEVEEAKALCASLEKRLKNAEHEYECLQEDHARKRNLLEISEEDAEALKRQTESFREELEQEKRKGKGCSERCRTACHVS